MKPSVTENCLPIARRRVAAGLVLLLMLSACSGPATDAEAELREWLSTAQAAAEAKERRKLMSMISPAYSDARGLDSDDVENRFRLYFHRQNVIRLLVSIDEIRVIGDTAAVVDLTAGLTGTNDGALGFSASAYRFELELEKADGDWELLSARWGRLGDEVY
ncbi:MAG TPA: hypothetical protein PKH39_03130 [Woeseiaceae bacterium]|nr:hypothetical protein [Woeseiaceae bacterium]